MTHILPPSDRSDRSTTSPAPCSARFRPGLSGVLLLAAALLIPTATPVQAQQGQPDRREIVSQLQQVIRQLRPIRQRAMQDPALQARRDSVVKLIRERMKGQSDTTAARVEQLQGLEADMRSAQQASDTTRMKELQGELRRLSKSLNTARKQAMQSPQVQQRLMQFQEAVRAKMREIDPAADSLLSRADSLRALLRGQGGGPGG